MRPTRVEVLIPVLDRPKRVEPVLASLGAPGPNPAIQLNPVFICSPHDRAEIKAVLEAGVIPLLTRWAPRAGDYARKMNMGFELTSGDWIFLGADDLVFHPGWIDECLTVAALTGCHVIGTNDLGNSRTIKGDLSTHTLVHRRYGERGTIDDPTKLLHEGYDHNFVDDEFISTARARRAYAHAPRAIVEHLHPSWSKAIDDATYRKGMRKFTEDRRLFQQRRHLWLDPAVV